MADILIASVLWILVLTEHFLQYHIHAVQLGTQIFCQCGGINLLVALYKVVDLIGGKQRLGVEGHFAVGVYKLHVHPCADCHYLSILTQHVAASLAGWYLSGCIAHSYVGITAVDYVVVVTYLQVSACSVLVLVLVSVLTEIDDGRNGVADVRGTIYQVAAALIENHISFCHILQRLYDTPIGVQGILCHFIGVAFTVWGQHILAWRINHTQCHAADKQAYNWFLFHNLIFFWLQVDGYT